ncbi:hypothetical protein IWZ03DRAFT_210893 [Phyllosticta citriasiana]|uniref:Uncharacterized protein n=1 Tax=Phyllosticta citriasiana TaxID=595635 RepID=A0ABR1KKS6_9PEZI
MTNVVSSRPRSPPRAFSRPDQTRPDQTRPDVFGQLASNHARPNARPLPRHNHRPAESATATSRRSIFDFRCRRLRSSKPRRPTLSQSTILFLTPCSRSIASSVGPNADTRMLRKYGRGLTLASTWTAVCAGDRLHGCSGRVDETAARPFQKCRSELADVPFGLLVKSGLVARLLVSSLNPISDCLPDNMQRWIRYRLVSWPRPLGADKSCKHHLPFDVSFATSIFKPVTRRRNFSISLSCLSSARPPTVPSDYP